MGIVKRIPDPEDGRARLVVFTDQGRASMVEGLGVLKEVEREATRNLGASAIEQLKHHLEELMVHLEAAELEDDLT